MMNSIELINNIMSRYYITKEIKDRDHLIEVLNEEITINQFSEAINYLQETLDSDIVENVLYVGFLMKFFNAKNESTLRRILVLNFHKSHEDIVSLFQSNYNQSIDNIPILLKAMNNIPEYLQPEDFKYTYIKKILYAIGAQPEPYNIQALQHLVSQIENTEFKELALHQIEKRNRLGRWEWLKNSNLK